MSEGIKEWWRSLKRYSAGIHYFFHRSPCSPGGGNGHLSSGAYVIRRLASIRSQGSTENTTRRIWSSLIPHADCCSQPRTSSNERAWMASIKERIRVRKQVCY